MNRKLLVSLALLVLLVSSVTAYRIFADDTSGLGLYSIFNVTWVNATEDVCVGSTCLSTVSGGSSDSSFTNGSAISVSELVLENPPANCSSGNYRMIGFAGNESYCRDINQSLINTADLNNDAGFITATLTEEQVEDYVGGMVTGNTETDVAVTYQDADGTLDFEMSDTPTFEEVNFNYGQYISVNATCLVIHSSDTLTTLEVCN